MNISPFKIISDTEFNQQNLLDLIELITPARNFFRCQFDTVEFRNLKSPRMCFTHCTFSDCKFIASDFDKMDLEGCVFINCEFSKMSLVQCDVKTCKWINCITEETNFDYALLNRNEFEKCEFKNSSFKYVYSIENIYGICAFLNIDTKQTTATLNEYSRCKFEGFEFTDGTFAFHIFWQCRFSHCSMGWATVGISYGLSHENLKQLDMVHYFEQLEVEAPDDLIQFIIEQFQEADNKFRMLVTSSNFGVKKYQSILYLLNYLLVQRSEAKFTVRHEEILFFRLILKFETTEGKLPAVILSHLAEQIEQESDNEWNDFRNLKSFLSYLIESEQTKFLKEMHSWNFHEKEQVRVKIVFSRRPEKTVRDLILHRPINDQYKAELIDYAEQKGSYIEVITASIAFLTTVRIILYLLVGNADLVARFLNKLYEIRKNYNRLVSGSQHLKVPDDSKATQKLSNFTYSLSGLEKKELFQLSDQFTNEIERIEIDYNDAFTADQDVP